MSFLELLPKRARVIVTALPTYLALAITFLTIFADEIVGLLPEAQAAQVGGWIVVAIAWLTGVINVVQRLSPALPSTYGLLVPHEYDQRHPSVDRDDTGITTAETVLAVAAVAMLVILGIIILDRI